MPQVSASAMNDETQKHLMEGRASIPAYKSYLDWLEDVHSRLAKCIKAHADEIAITHHTTEGMNIALWGVDWQPGEAIITTTHEHGALLTQLATLHKRFGVEIVYLPFNGDVMHDTQLFQEACETTTPRMLAMSHVNWIDGVVFPIKELTQMAHAEGASVLIDGAQSAGAIPIDIHDLGVDFFAAPGQKWLCGPEGSGFFYVRREWLSRLQPTFTGFFGIKQLHWFDQTSPYYVPAEGAKRFHTGGFCRQAVYGLEASLRWWQDDVGMDWAFKRMVSLVNIAREKLQAVSGLEVETPASKKPSPLLSFRIKGIKPEVVRDHCDAHQVLLRDIPGDDPVVRISVGWFNTEEEIDTLVQVLSKL